MITLRDSFDARSDSIRFIIFVLNEIQCPDFGYGYGQGPSWFQLRERTEGLKESNCLLDWVSNCKLSLNSLEKDIKAAQTGQILISK